MNEGSKKMYILSICESHNCTAAIFADGELIACASEERFCRVKNELGLPISAMGFCLDFAGIKAGQLDKVIVATEEEDPVQYCMKRGTSDVFSLEDWIKEEYEYYYPRIYEKKDVSFADVFRDKLGKNYRTVPQKYRDDMTPEEFNRERVRAISGVLGIGKDKIVFMDHHKAHAAYAHCAITSDGKDKIVATADSFGDGLNATVSIVKNGKIRRVFQTDRCDLGRMYKFMTLLLGMKPIEHEYKVMGLAPYAKHYVYEKPYDIFDRTLQVEGLDFRYREKPTDLYFYFQRKLAGCRFDGIAAGLQLFLEDRLKKWFGNMIDMYGVSTIAFSGGLSMNVKANKAISELEGVKEFIVPPSGGDESLAIGAGYAYLLDNHPEIAIRPMNTSYLGPEYTNMDAMEVFEKNGYAEKFDLKRNVPPQEVARLLADGKVVARMSGRMEFGARALGNRSIIADPSNRDVVKKINEMVKNRDFWMPFAPSVLRERAGDYIVYPEGKKLTDEFMTMAFDSTALARREIIAGLHPYDYTLRPHVVSRDKNPGYHELIRCFEELTGIGAVLNTSFNLHGYPIVCLPGDAFEVLENSGLDHLYINDLLFTKKELVSKGKGKRKKEKEEEKVAL